ncbi:hypothetical protein HW130_35275 [Streptomyces sp. PKU-EA00015]|uniref:hypothetical protein n=1 Tax=Streptomyces sp. PKU-EA00015 TaxID=2748326 RepID=UPI0015A419F7|nr:hypothetical protein [Streptomyces sp. PKU-EA00015]NWF31413.1 hypothetical protein [Streptomyces sp. PKU-EA00015]
MEGHRHGGGVTKQSAHEKRGSSTVEAWDPGQPAPATSPSSALPATPRAIDAWHAGLFPDEPYAVTSALAATDPRNVVNQQAAEASRAEAAHPANGSRAYTPQVPVVQPTISLFPKESLRAGR